MHLSLKPKIVNKKNKEKQNVVCCIFGWQILGMLTSSTPLLQNFIYIYIYVYIAAVFHLTVEIL